MSALGTEEEPSERSALALVALAHSDHEVRVAFLRAALGSGNGLGAIESREQGISVALSQVDYSEAVSLYRDAIRPALMSPHSSKLLRACFALIYRWSLFSQISAADAARIASQIADGLATEREAASLDVTSGDVYSAAIEDLAPRLSPESAAGLAAKLFDRATTASEVSVVRAATQALMAVAPRISADSRRELAKALVARLTTERRWAVILLLSPALAPLSATLDAAAAGNLAGLLAGRIASEWNPETIDALISAFRVTAAKADDAAARKIGATLLDHVKLEPDPSVLLLVTQALVAFGDKLPAGIYQEAGEALLQRLKTEGNAGTLSVYAFSLGVLKDRAGEDQLEGASSEIVSRIVKERDLQTLASLAAAVEPVADDLDPAAAERLSTMLVDRMMREYDAGSLLYLAVALDSIADEARGRPAASLVAQLSGRMRREERANVLRSLAFSVAGFKNADGNFDAPAEALVSRMKQENAPDELRALSSGLYALRDKVSAQAFEKAAAILASRIETQLNPTSIRSLADSLHALGGKAGAQPFEHAATAIVANVNNFAALEPALRHVAAHVRAAKAKELSSVLIERIGKEQDAGMLRVLGQALADLPITGESQAPVRIFEIPDAPCQASHSAVQLFNPLCSESAWNELAAEVTHAKRRSPEDEVPPDFAQLAPDDDDVATGPSREERPLDFREISKAAGADRPPRETPRSTGLLFWPGLGLLAGGALVLFFSLRAPA